MGSSYLLVNGLRYHYFFWNRGERGRPLLLLHGLASSGRIWELSAPHLAERGFVVYAPDLRGHGLSDKPQGDYGFETFSRDIVMLVYLLEIEKPLLVGHSWGAMVALDYATRFASVSHAPAGLVLVDGGMEQLDDTGLTWEEMRQRLTPPPPSGLPLDVFLSRLSSHNLRCQLPAEAVRIILANFEVTQDKTIYPRLRFEHHMQIVRAMWEFKTYEHFKRLSCPVLLLPTRPPQPRSAQEEEFLRFKERGLEKVLPLLKKGHLIWMEDTIHDVPLQRPHELAKLISDFALSLV